jgi:hypothetical protein
MKNVILCLIVGLFGFLASGYVAFRAASYRKTVVKAEPADRTDLGGYKYEERLRSAFFPAFFLTFGSGVAITLGAMVLVLYLKKLECGPRDLN